MKEIVVISGKGGTGKTSVMGSFSYLGKSDLVIADCDVDAADLHMLLGPDYQRSEDYYSGELAILDQDKCINCGACLSVCQFDGIQSENGTFRIEAMNCEGCGYCQRVCPTNAIQMETQKVGEWYTSSSKVGSTMVHAKLGVGAENSGRLVAQVKNEARRHAKKDGKEIILIDGSPGIGCAVNSALSGADYVVFVTEPSVSGIHDLKRVTELVKGFSIRSGCIINKCDLNSQMLDELITFMADAGIEHIASIPYDETFTAAMLEGKTLVEYDKGPASQVLIKSWEKIKQFAETEGCLK